MDIRQFFNILIKRWWVILILVIIGVAASAFYSYNSYKPMYSSEMTLLIVNSDSTDQNYAQDSTVSYSDLMAGQQMVKEFKEVIMSRSVAKEVADGLKLLDISIADVESGISVGLKDETRLLIVNYVNKNPARTKQVLDKISDVFKSRVQKISKALSVSVIDGAEVPSAPIPPNHTKKVLIGFLAGFIGAIGIIFLIEELDDTIKTAEDVETLLDIKVLGTIPSLSIK